MKTTADVVVVGGGISGLTTAFWLAQSGVDVLVLEREPHVGGTMRTYRDGGWLIESGPNSALETTPLFSDMFAKLGIDGDHAYANPAADRRYILRDGTLHALPMSPGGFLSTRLWSMPAKFRLLKEPFIGRAKNEETVADFVVRRLGREFLDYAINPFVAGVFAGNPEQLSLRASFPKLYALEEKYGGLFKGMIRGARERKKRAEKAKDRARMFSFRNGMQTFPDAIGRALGERVCVECDVKSIAQAAQNGGSLPRYEVWFSREGSTRFVTAHAVCISIPARPAAGLIRQFHPLLSSSLEAVHYPPVTEVFLGFREGRFRQKLDGFGYLVPQKENRNILGTIWSSTLFAGRAPAGYCAFTSFVGGSRQPELAGRDDADVIRMVTEDINSIMGGKGKPDYSRIIRWANAIPQYNIGHLDVMERIDEFESRFAGMFVCSNYRGGISVGDCVMNGERTAGRIREFLAESSLLGVPAARTDSNISNPGGNQ